MTFSEFSDAELAKVRNSVDNVASVKSRVTLLLENLKRVTQGQHIQQRWGVSIEPGDDFIATIQTPHALGRGRLEFGVGPKGSQGLLYIERQFHNELDQPIWRKVWAIRIDPYSLYLGELSEQALDFDGYNDDEQYARIVLSILYSIANGSSQ